MGPEIGENLEPDISHLVYPGVQSGDVVNGNAQQHRVALIKEMTADSVAWPLI